MLDLHLNVNDDGSVVGAQSSPWVPSSTHGQVSVSQCDVGVTGCTGEGRLVHWLSLMVTKPALSNCSDRRVPLVSSARFAVSVEISAYYDICHVEESTGIWFVVWGTAG